MRQPLNGVWGAKRDGRWIAALALICGFLVGCGDDDAVTETQPEDSIDAAAVSTTSTTAPAPGPRAGATYVGPIEGEPGLAGQVTLVVAESGEEITELMLDLDMDGYACDSSTMSGGLGLGIGSPVAIIDDTFDTSDGSMVWEGTFETEMLAAGTVKGSLPVMGGPPCELGPFPWTAEPSEPGSTTDPAAEPEASDPASTTAGPSTDLEAMFVDQFFAYPAMESVVPADQLACASGLAAELLTGDQIDELDQPSPSAEVMMHAGTIVDACFVDETILALLAVGLRDGGGLTQPQADCVAAGLATLDKDHLGVLLSIEDPEEQPPELSQRVFEAIDGCLQ